MPHNRIRILLIRSGRHLGIALGVLAKAHPGCEVWVLATHGAEREVTRAGIPRDRYLIYKTRPRFCPSGMLRGGMARQIWAQRFDRVAVLWPDAAGSDQANVDRTALAISPRGFDAITPDGRIVARRTITLLAREMRRAPWSTFVCVGLGLYRPAAIIRAIRERAVVPVPHATTGP